ncbi:MAG: protein-L-isoaspartate(D-aspartate) O-methyltransferase [Thermoplasmatota archaeon]
MDDVGREGSQPPPRDPGAEQKVLVDRLERWGEASPRVAEVLRRVPRHRFLPDAARSYAYRDEPISIGEGQTMSAPHMVALMATWADFQAGHRVLEVGGGSGYHAAVAAELVSPGGHVWSVERVASLASSARRNLAETGYADHVTVVEGDGSAGLPHEAPFDRIFVTAAAPAVPSVLVDQLVVHGRLLIPVGSRDVQEMVLVEKQGTVGARDLGPVRFVPLLGQFGFAP